VTFTLRLVCCSIILEAFVTRWSTNSLSDDSSESESSSSLDSEESSLSEESERFGRGEIKRILTNSLSRLNVTRFFFLLIFLEPLTSPFLLVVGCDVSELG